MASEMAAMLDALMGRDRNELPSERQEFHFSDADVCKHYLVGLCPSTLFTNTKSDLGPCPNRHDDAMKSQWDALSDEERAKYPYEADLVLYAQDIVATFDRQIERNTKKLADQFRVTSELASGSAEMARMTALNTEIDALAQRIGMLGEEGLVDEAAVLVAKLDELKREKDALSRTAEVAKLTGPEKNLTVCDTCGFVIPLVSSNAEIYGKHTEGKQHVGSILLRDLIREYKEKHGALPAPKAAVHERSREREGERSRERSRDVDRRRERAREDERRRSRERSGRNRRDYDRHRRDEPRRDDRDRYHSRERERRRDSYSEGHRGHERARKRSRSRSAERARKRSERY